MRPGQEQRRAVECADSTRRLVSPCCRGTSGVRLLGTSSSSCSRTGVRPRARRASPLRDGSVPTGTASTTATASNPGGRDLAAVAGQGLSRARRPATRSTRRTQASPRRAGRISSRADAGSRTPDPSLTKRVLWPSELRRQESRMLRDAGDPHQLRTARPEPAARAAAGRLSSLHEPPTHAPPKYAGPKYR